MDKYNGYKLKPSSYQIQPNDIIIRVKNGSTGAPIGTLGVALGNDWVSLPTQSQWSTDYPDWRAIETKPGFEAEVGDTVYCIKYTGGSCKTHDLFIVKNITTTRSTKSLGPQQGHTLLNKKITEENWGWSSNDFVVLIKGDEDLSIKKEIDTIQDLIESIPNNRVITVYVDSMMDKPTQTKPNTKGKQMNSSLFTDILKLLTQVEQTDLQKAPSAYAFFYNEDGEYEGTAKVANEAEAKALLQRPEHLGYTMRIYSFSDEFTTYMPVVSTIKKTVEANPTKPVRKPRAPKVK